MAARKSLASRKGAQRPQPHYFFTRTASTSPCKPCVLSLSPGGLLVALGCLLWGRHAPWVETRNSMILLHLAQELLEMHWPLGHNPSLLLGLAAVFPGCLNFPKTGILSLYPGKHFAALKYPPLGRYAPWVEAMDSTTSLVLVPDLRGRLWPLGKDLSLLLSLTTFFPRLPQRPPASLASYCCSQEEFLPLWAASRGEDTYPGCKPGPSRHPLGPAKGLGCQ